ncbi:hypothetical protein [Bacillus massiliigorillae]|uniref:hypothetical protein n=1 Tax=Bacillus massiliigorillae TaxID=1243664 RepID=UPI000399F2CF|nr:hypothetical protein [Bacillus massiliigorillae]
MNKIDSTIYVKFEQEGLTAGEKAAIWMDVFPSDVVSTFFKKTLSLYDNFADNNYFPKNPFFPEILNHLFSTDQELAQLFIKEFFPEHIYQAFMRSEELTPTH